MILHDAMACDHRRNLDVPPGGDNQSFGKRFCYMWGLAMKLRDRGGAVCGKPLQEHFQACLVIGKIPYTATREPKSIKPGSSSGCGRVQ